VVATQDTGIAPRLPKHWSARLDEVLDDGEQLVWFAQPNAHRWGRKGYMFVPMGLAILAFALRALPHRGAAWFWFIEMMLFLFALFLVVSPWVLQARAKSTLYVITGHRALILGSGKRDSLRAYRLQDLEKWDMRPRSDGSGDLILETEYFEDADGAPQSREHGFEEIAEVGLVQHILESIKGGADPALVRRQAAQWRHVRALV
jgi:hypothetical protein